MGGKIVYKKDALLGDNAYYSDAMRDIDAKDKKQILNRKKERDQLFHALKKYRDGGVTESEMKSALADLKYHHDNDFTPKEVNALADELGLGTITKAHLPHKSLPHMSRMARAQHHAEFASRQRHSARASHTSQNDDIAQFVASDMMKKLLREKRKDVYVNGDVAFDQEEEEMFFRDPQTGRRFNLRTSRLKRPDLHMRTQTSLRGRGLTNR